MNCIKAVPLRLVVERVEVAHDQHRLQVASQVVELPDQPAGLIARSFSEMCPDGRADADRAYFANSAAPVSNELSPHHDVAGPGVRV